MMLMQHSQSHLRPLPLLWLLLQALSGQILLLQHQLQLLQAQLGQPVLLQHQLPLLLWPRSHRLRRAV